MKELAIMSQNANNRPPLVVNGPVGEGRAFGPVQQPRTQFFQ